jgi:Tfp pilus assembly protein PilO
MAKLGGGPASADAPATGATAARPRFTLKPSKQTCVILGVMMGAVLAGSAALYFWQSGEIAATEVIVNQKQAQVASGERVARRLQEVEAAYNDTQGKLRYLETSVTKGEYVPTLLKQMEGLAKSVNLKVSSVRPHLEPAPEPPKEPEARKKWKPQPYDKLMVDMEVSGTYWSTAKMMYRLTEFPKIMTVDTVQLAPQNAAVGATSPNLTVRMKVIGFIFPNDTKIVAPEMTSPATKPDKTSAAAAEPTTPQPVKTAGA